MPTTTKCLSESDANKAIGGIPTIHYFDFQSRGRGQVLRLMWEDASIAYEDVRYSFEEYPEYKKTKISEMNPISNIPVLELNGRILTQSYAILRHFARQLGKYDGETEKEKYWADAMCDIVIDWRSLFIQAFFSDNMKETYPEHCKTCRPRFLQALETHLKTHDLSRSGPFVIGKQFTYADMVLYQVLHDENLTQEGRKGIKNDYPRLTQLVDAVESRPNIKAFLQSDRYRG
ncbi:glutathione S-transferase, partial [Lecanoromycetidae sp. Uapishka_2]